MLTHSISTHIVCPPFGVYSKGATTSLYHRNMLGLLQRRLHLLTFVLCSAHSMKHWPPHFVQSQTPHLGLGPGSISKSGDLLLHIYQSHIVGSQRITLVMSVHLGHIGVHLMDSGSMFLHDIVGLFHRFGCRVLIDSLTLFIH
jgi:hypothetical protein